MNANCVAYNVTLDHRNNALTFLWENLTDFPNSYCRLI